MGQRRGKHLFLGVIQQGLLAVCMCSMLVLSVADTQPPGGGAEADQFCVPSVPNPFNESP